MNKRSAVEGEKQGACSQERRTVCWAEPQREQDEREAEGRAGDKPTSSTSHPYSQQPSPFTRLLESYLRMRCRKKLDYVFV